MNSPVQLLRATPESIDGSHLLLQPVHVHAGRDGIQDLSRHLLQQDAGQAGQWNAQA